MRKILIGSKIVKINFIKFNFWEITLSPLNRGYGQTIGNALRRILLSSITGYSATKISVLNVLHEYSSLKGVKEDIFDIILNIRGLIFKVSDNSDKNFIYLNKNIPGVVLASDILLPKNIEILNPDHVIANLSIGGSLNIKIKVEKGIGYTNNNLKKVNKKKYKSSANIFLDTCFSPIRRVFYNIKNSSIDDEKKDFEKLIISIETNGTINPINALKKSVIILIKQLNSFFKFKKKKKIVHQKKIEINSLFFEDISFLGLTTKTFNCLKLEKIFLIGDLVQKNKYDLLKIPNFNKKSLNEIKNIFNKYNLKLNIQIKDWDFVVKYRNI